MSATWNSGRLRIISATRSPRPIPSPVNAVAIRVAASPYCAYVISCQASPTCQRNAPRSPWPVTPSRKSVATVWPAVAAAICSFVQLTAPPSSVAGQFVAEDRPPDQGPSSAPPVDELGDDLGTTLGTTSIGLWKNLGTTRRRTRH